MGTRRTPERAGGARGARQAEVIGAAAVVAGQLAMLVVGARAGGLWGWVPDPDPPCLLTERCTPETIDALRSRAWEDLLPGAAVLLVGLVVGLLAVRCRPDDPRGPASRRRTAALASAASACTALLGLVSVVPVVIASAISPPFAVAVVVGIGLTVASVLARLVRTALPGRDALPLGVTAAALSGAVGIGAGAVADAVASEELAVVVVVVTAAATAGLVVGLGLACAGAPGTRGTAAEAPAPSTAGTDP